MPGLNHRLKQVQGNSSGIIITPNSKSLQKQIWLLSSKSSFWQSPTIESSRFWLPVCSFSKFCTFFPPGFSGSFFSPTLLESKEFTVVDATQVGNTRIGVVLLGCSLYKEKGMKKEHRAYSIITVKYFFTRFKVIK